MPKTRRHQNYNDSSENIHENNISNNADEGNDSSSCINNMEENPSLRTNSPMECNWVAGHLAWARVGNFPFWPCIVTPDPNSLIYHKFIGKFTVSKFISQIVTFDELSIQTNDKSQGIIIPL